MEHLDISPPRELKSPLKVPHKLLMGPGPSNTAPRVLQAMSQPILGHMHGELFKVCELIYNAILIVDCVASLGAVPLLVDKWKIDVIYSGSQKIISAPPGLAPISFSSRAKNIIFNRTTPIKSYYWDIKLIGQQWNCFGENVARIYHHTTSAPLLFALREALAILAEEGLKNVITRHQECANILYDGLNKIGLELYIKDKCKRLPSVTSVKVPDEVNWRAVADFAMKNYNLEISGGLGPTMGKVFRIGLMGYNATNENVLTTLGIVKESLNYARNKTNSKL
ncbi:hypothetical protein GWI33_006086 [Rhynchophorus ferrugineus]|uniref:alanine--glyoxylate transaminase n=1 Tax=Rhynchophorus ferrugineus TaxID=354439 RepID=A0A834ME24_RHYFE|nr:hypothetical protein GWI33_006086 [Rhynchophorus ferrugineus]